MSKKWIWLLGLVCCTAVAGLVLAEGVEWDADAVNGMSRAERLAYQQVYKAKIEALARAEGWVPGEKRAFEGSGRQAAPPNKAFGSITYDSGALGTCCAASKTIGNHFDSALNPAGTAISPVMMSGSITRIHIHMASLGGTGAFISVFDQLAGTTANLVTSFFQPGLAAGTDIWITLAAPIPYVGSTFLAGVWQNATATGADRLAVATGTVSGQGFHGMSINDIVATGFTTLPALNAAYEVSGDVLTPVELLNFEVE